MGSITPYTREAKYTVGQLGTDQMWKQPLLLYLNNEIHRPRENKQRSTTECLPRSINTHTHRIIQNLQYVQSNMNQIFTPHTLYTHSTTSIWFPIKTSSSEIFRASFSKNKFCGSLISASTPGPRSPHAPLTPALAPPRKKPKSGRNTGNNWGQGWKHGFSMV